MGQAVGHKFVCSTITPALGTQKKARPREGGRSNRKRFPEGSRPMRR